MKLAAPLALSLVLAAGAQSWAQGLSEPETAFQAPALKFEVLEVTVGSGSKSREVERFTVDFNESAPPEAVGDGAWIMAAVTSPSGRNLSAGLAPASAALSVVSASASAEDQAAGLAAAMEQWHRQTVASYNYNIPALDDPFLPIKEVRGKPDEVAALAEATLPPILRLELNQLRLVAITTLSGRGSSLASFEDGAGVSYILRQGDRIGRNNGRIVKIEPAQVIVEETPRGASEPRLVEMKLNVLNTQGLIRASDEDAEDQGGLYTY